LPGIEQFGWCAPAQFGKFVERGSVETMKFPVDIEPMKDRTAERKRRIEVREVITPPCCRWVSRFSS